MKIITKKKLILVAFLITIMSTAQVPRKTLVEHFTNTKCSICASRNPGFYSNLNSQPGILHLAIHPSSPYSACLLSMHNPTENDARTNYYGVYGSTPRLVIQGSVISGAANYASSSLFSPYINGVSPISIKVNILEKGSDSLKIMVVLKAETTHTLSSQSLFVAIVEDTLFYTGSNGESTHFDVFRKSVTGASGISVATPVLAGDSTSLEFTSAVWNGWDKNRIYALAVLQNGSDKAINQVERSEKSLVPTGIGAYAMSTFKGGVKLIQQGERLIIERSSNSGKFVAEVFEHSGKLVSSGELEGVRSTLVLAELVPGLYIVRLSTQAGDFYYDKIIIN